MHAPRRGLALIVAIALLAALAVVPQLPRADHDRVGRVASAFADGDYAALGGLLRPPCAARLLPGGDLELTDRRGDVHRVPSANLPLRHEASEDHELIALVGLGPAEHGVLLAPPTRVHLRLDDHAWLIVEVQAEAR